ncbi:MAG TPA: methyl-accepting chemotaxis protein [Magnetospirillum sp.]|jgi:methyl-accepting chemotaxis protein|nr:methyl-accepting chemotaxis protein [Magnetospirillum sp.]
MSKKVAAPLLAVTAGAIGALWLIPSPLWATIAIMVMAAAALAWAASGSQDAAAPVQAVERLLAGDTATPLAGQSPLIAALERLRQQLEERAQADKAKLAEQEMGLEKSRKRMGLLLSFDSMAGAMLETVTATMGEARSVADGLTHSAELTDSRSSEIAHAAECATSNLQTVASAAEQLSSSTQEISRQVANTSDIARRAVDGVARTHDTVQSLSQAAQQIGTVITLINDIAGQTNLLALNATIEAARAGDAGKGFAVVANEVKSLANQTGRATGEIAQQVAGIQDSTLAAVQAIADVTATINQVNDVVTSIASAVEEQSAATREIARNVQEAAQGNTQVADGIAQVSNAAAQSHGLAETMNAIADRLSAEATQLRGSVEKVLADIKAV